MIAFFIKLFLVAFFINLLYELLHSVLYKTCLDAPLKKYVYLMVKAALFDGFMIVVIYFLTGNITIFLVVSALFAYSWELYSLKKDKWEYAKTMPKILGAGITPTVQLALTGLASLYIMQVYY